MAAVPPRASPLPSGAPQQFQQQQQQNTAPSLQRSPSMPALSPPRPGGVSTNNFNARGPLAAPALDAAPGPQAPSPTASGKKKAPAVPLSRPGNRSGAVSPVAGNGSFGAPPPQGAGGLQHSQSASVYTQQHQQQQQQQFAQSGQLQHSSSMPMFNQANTRPVPPVPAISGVAANAVMSPQQQQQQQATPRPVPVSAPPLPSPRKAVPPPPPVPTAAVAVAAAPVAAAVPVVPSIPNSRAPSAPPSIGGVGVDAISPYRPRTNSHGSAVSVPAAPLHRPATPSRLGAGVDAVVAANRMQHLAPANNNNNGMSSVRSHSSTVAPAPPLPPPSPSRQHVSPGGLSAAVLAANRLASSPRKSVPPPPVGSRPGSRATSVGHNEGIQPYRVTPDLRELSENNLRLQQQAQQTVELSPSGRTRIPAVPLTKPTPSVSSQRDATDDVQFELRLLRQKVGALESEVTFLRRELDAARAANTSSRGGAGGGGRRYPSPVIGTAAQARTAVTAAVAAATNAAAAAAAGDAVPATEALSYSMREQQAQQLHGMSLEQRIAALQDLQYHMSMAKAITDNVHVSVLAAPRADALNVSPQRPASNAVGAHAAAGVVASSRDNNGVVYSPTQQQMIDAAVKDAQRALQEPHITPYTQGISRYLALGQPPPAQNYYAAAMAQPAPLQLRRPY